MRNPISKCFFLHSSGDVFYLCKITVCMCVFGPVVSGLICNCLHTAEKWEEKRKITDRDPDSQTLECDYECLHH